MNSKPDPISSASPHSTENPSSKFPQEKPALKPNLKRKSELQID